MIPLNKRVLFISILLTLTLPFSVSAAEITKVMVSDFDNSVITVSGTEDKSDRVSVVMLPKGSVLTEGTYLAESNISVQSAEVSEGKFDVSFKFVGDSMEYDFYADGSTSPFSFEFISKEAVQTFIGELGEKKYSKAEIPEKLNYFAFTMGIDIDFAKDQSTMEYLAESILAESEDIKDRGLVALTDIVAHTKAELAFMSKLAEVQTTSGVNTYLSEYEESARLNLTNYKKLTDAQKVYVCNALMGNRYTDISKFKSDFASLVLKAPREVKKEREDSPRSSSGSGGRSGTTSGNYFSQPDSQPTEDAENGRRLFDVFTDLDSVPWAWDAILYLSDNGIMNGVGNQSFAPDNKITREQFAKILSIAFGVEQKDDTHGFTDVPEDGWSGGYISAVKEAGFMQGIDEKNFGYGMNISREDICVTIVRAAKKYGYHFSNAKTDFNDFDSVSDYAKESVACLAGEGVVSGTDEDIFNPGASATRAEASKIIYSVIKFVFNK